MNLQEQNWINLFGNHTSEGTAWYGIWTRYSPELEVIKSFQGIRKFWSNEDKTVINQQNNYTYADGSTEEKKWQIEKEIANQPDGVIHSASESMRSLSLSEEANIWMCIELKIGNLFGCELFFQYQNFRTSVVSLYGENGDLGGFTQIREHLNSYPDPKPGAELKNISGNWVGKKESMTPDLQISQEPELTELDLDPTQGKNKTFFLPDGIVINVPEKVKIGEEFELVAGKMMIENKYKRMTVKYDKDGKFIQLISEIFDRKD
ncbi:MAG: DUF3598 family protein [Microcoleaceae cyanobacterium MO_207.B10]|nr:DUF3598 family protein [Microcoleaceae cyanobacterium MO_207.B10]